MADHGLVQYVEYNGMRKTRREWCAYLGVTYGSLMSRSSTRNSIHLALKCLHEERDKKKSSVAPHEGGNEGDGAIIAADELFYLAMTALIAKSLTCNEKIM